MNIDPNMEYVGLTKRAQIYVQNLTRITGNEQGCLQEWDDYGYIVSEVVYKIVGNKVFTNLHVKDKFGKGVTFYPCSWLLVKENENTEKEYDREKGHIYQKEENTTVKLLKEIIKAEEEKLEILKEALKKEEES